MFGKPRWSPTGHLWLKPQMFVFGFSYFIPQHGWPVVWFVCHMRSIGIQMLMLIWAKWWVFVCTFIVKVGIWWFETSELIFMPKFFLSSNIFQQELQSELTRASVRATNPTGVKDTNMNFQIQKLRRAFAVEYRTKRHRKDTCVSRKLGAKEHIAWEQGHWCCIPGSYVQ